MRLAALFRDYLFRDRAHGPARALASALRQEGCALQGALLDIYLEGATTPDFVPPGHGVWTGNRVFLGPTPPEQPLAGDIWFDVCELSPMLLVPREGCAGRSRDELELSTEQSEFYSWLSILPVADWQFAVFRELAPTRGSLLAPGFEVASAPRAAAGVTHGEARLYCNWFGKGLAGLFDWQLTVHAFADPIINAMWSGLPREWAGDLLLNEDVLGVALSPETWLSDPDEMLDEAGSDHPMIQRRATREKTTGFRTRVYADLGVVHEWHARGNA